MIERRRKSDRLLIALQGIAALFAVVALILTLIFARLTTIENRHSGCVLLRQIVMIATPPNKQNDAQKFIDSTPLANCDKYAGHFLP